MHNEIRLWIASENKGYCVIGKLLKSKLLSKKSNEHLLVSYICPALIYRCETWSASKEDEEKIDIFERRILCRIYGPIIENREYRKQTN